MGGGPILVLPRAFETAFDAHLKQHLFGGFLYLGKVGHFRSPTLLAIPTYQVSSGGRRPTNSLYSKRS